MSRSPRYDLDPALEDEPFGIEVVEELVRAEARSLVESEKAIVHFLKRVYATLTDSTHQMRTLETDIRRKRLAEVRDAVGPATPQEYFEAARQLTPEQLHSLYDRSFRDRITEIEDTCAEINALRARLRPEIRGAQVVLDGLLARELPPPTRERLTRARSRVPADPGAEVLDPREVLGRAARPAPVQAPPATPTPQLPPAPPPAALPPAASQGAPSPLPTAPQTAPARPPAPSPPEDELPEIPELPPTLRDLF